MKAAILTLTHLGSKPRSIQAGLSRHSFRIGLPPPAVVGVYTPHQLAAVGKRAGRSCTAKER